MLEFARSHVPIRTDGKPDTDAGSNVMDQLGGTTPALAGVFAPGPQALAAVLADLQGALPSTTVVGSSTAGQFTDAGEHAGAAVVWAIGGALQAHAHMANGLYDSPADAVARVAAGAGPSGEAYPHRTALVFMDGTAGNGEEVTLMLSGQLGPEVKLAGGAAADNFAMRSSWVATGDRVTKDALVLAVIDSAIPLGIGVQHGHQALSRPLTVTRADHNVVREIDGRPAWDVWLEQTRERARELGIDPDTLQTPEEVFDFLNRFEAGLTVGESYKLRVPLARDNGGALRFGCGVPEGTVLRVMESSHEAQIASAGAAAREASERIGGSDNLTGVLVFDCSCRKTILADDFWRGVDAMRNALGDVGMAGFETYGEIAMDPEATSGFHNTTTVVLALPAS